jgi:hypothetical protein
MSTTDGLISIVFKLESAILQQQVKSQVDKVVKELADKYAPYFDVKWKTICDGTNNTVKEVDAHKFVLDVYVTVPLVMDDFLHAHVETTFTATPSLPK